MKNKKTYLLLAVIWTILIGYLSLSNLGNIGSNIKILYKDKILHFVFYFLFVILWNLYRNPKFFDLKTGISIVFIAIIYGEIIEILQGILTITRCPDVIDVFANTLGAICGLWLVKFMFNKKLN